MELLQVLNLLCRIQYLFKLSITRKFFRHANLCWVNEECCSAARLTRPSTDRWRTNQLLGLGRNINSIAVAMLTGHCIMGRHAGRIGIPLKEFQRVCRFAEDEEAVIHFPCQCLSLASCRYRLFGSPIVHLWRHNGSLDVLKLAFGIKSTTLT